MWNFECYWLAGQVVKQDLGSRIFWGWLLSLNFHHVWEQRLSMSTVNRSLSDKDLFENQREVNFLHWGSGFFIQQMMRNKDGPKPRAVEERHAERLILCMNPCEQAGGARAGRDGRAAVLHPAARVSCCSLANSVNFQWMRSHANEKLVYRGHIKEENML